MMKAKYLVLLLLIMSFSGFGQDNTIQEGTEQNSNEEPETTEEKLRRFSLEVSYPINFQSNIFYKMIGYGGLGFKYRFKNAESVNLGLALTADYLERKETKFLSLEQRLFNSQALFAHVDFLTEFKLKDVKGLLFFGEVGYSYLWMDNDFGYSFQYSQEDNSNHHGYNYKLGTSYAFSKRWFLQAYLHGSRIYLKQSIYGELSAIDAVTVGINFTQLKIGIGVKL